MPALTPLALALLASGLAAEAPSGATGRIGVQVLALQPESGVPRESTKLLTDFLVSELARRAGLQVFGQSDLESLLEAAKEKRSLECNSDADACLAEVAGAMGAQWLIGGNVGILGDRLLINVRLTDTRRHRILAHVSEETSGGTEDLLEAIKRLVPRLLDEAEVDAHISLSPPRKRTTAYVLLGSAIACAVGGGVAGGVSYDYWSQANAASQAYLYRRQLPPGSTGGSYTITKGAIEPWGIGAGVALGVALALGIGTWVAW